jgi:hypothetical protein
MMDAKQLTLALAGLSDAEWARFKDVEDRRRGDQRAIRDLAKELRELRKIDRGPAR